MGLVTPSHKMILLTMESIAAMLGMQRAVVRYSLGNLWDCGSHTHDGVWFQYSSESLHDLRSMIYILLMGRKLCFLYSFRAYRTWELCPYIPQGVYETWELRFTEFECEHEWMSGGLRYMTNIWISKIRKNWTKQA